jgi:hypothetical protein
MCALSMSLAGCGVVRQGLPEEVDARPADAGTATRPADGPPARDAPAAGAPDYGLPARAPGASCESDRECASGFCVDGVCCQSACAGPCEACDLPGSMGSCLPVTGAPRGQRPPCLGAGSPCAGSCDGQARTSCQYPAGETECAPASCGDGIASARSVCSGTGVCLPPTMVSCAPFSCSGAICAGGCSAAVPCAPENVCLGGRCLPLAEAGAACTAPGQCRSGYCASGRCCNRACTGACESCDRPGRPGSCGTVPFDSDVNNCGGCGVRCPGTRCLQGACEKIEFEFSFVGMVAGKTCLSVDEPSDPHFWADNYLCTQRDFGLRWSIAGAIPGMTCTQIVEPSDPDAWSDNFLCAPVDYGLRWSFVGPIPDMRCTLVNEPSDPNFWGDNYLCAPP